MGSFYLSSKALLPQTETGLQLHSQKKYNPRNIQHAAYRTESSAHPATDRTKTKRM